MSLTKNNKMKRNKRLSKFMQIADEFGRIEMEGNVTLIIR